MNKTLGSIWLKRSRTALGPSSEPQEDHIAPMLVAASIAMAVSIRLGIYAATRSPTATPISRSDFAKRATELYSSA